MSIPKLDPSAFTRSHSCSCEHCECLCDECTGVYSVWFKVGDTLLSDRAIMLPPEAFASQPDPVLHTIPQPEVFTQLMAATYCEQPSDEEFDKRYLDPLEVAGYQVRPQVSPLPTHARCHAVMYDGSVVGLLMPVNEPEDRSRRAA